MDINSWIEEVHRNKHNMIPVVKLAISKPIEALLETTNLTNDFPTSLLPVIKSKKNEADDIMSYLSSIGSTEATKEDEVAQLEKQIDFVVNSIIPQIKEFSLFFQQFTDKDFYFAKTDGGQRVLGLVQKAPSRCEISCQGLSKLKIDSPISVSPNKSFRLIEVGEEVFDELDNINVIYKCSDRELQICTNKADFQTEVLQNIAENIKRHAFPYAEYANKLVIDKIVELQITNDDNKVIIRVTTVQ